MATWDIPLGGAVSVDSTWEPNKTIQTTQPSDFAGATINSVTVVGTPSVTSDSTTDDTIGFRVWVVDFGDIPIYGNNDSDANSICSVSLGNGVASDTWTDQTPNPAPTTVVSADWSMVRISGNYSVNMKNDNELVSWSAFDIRVDYTPSGSTTNKTLTHSGVGTAAAPVKEVGVNRSFSGIGTSVLSRAAALARTFTFSGVGTGTISKSMDLVKTFSGLGTAVLSTSKVALLELAYAGTGAAVLATTSVLGKLLSYSGTGTSSVLKEIGKTLSNTGSGLAAIARNLTLSRTLTYAGTAASALVREVQKTLAYAGTGTSVLVAIKSKLLNLVYSAVGSAAQVKEIGKSFSLSGTGTQVLSRTSSFLRSISFSGTGTSAVAKGMDMAILIGAAGTAAIGTVKAKLVSLTYSALGTASTAKTVLLTRVLSALGTTALQKEIGKFFTPSGVGTMVANATKTFFRTIVVGGVGTCVALAESGLQHLATTTGTATLTLRKQVGIFRAYVGSGVVAGTKVIEKTLGINVLGTPAEQDSLVTNHNSAMTGTGTPETTEQFQAGGPPGLILAKRIIRAILIRVNRWF